MKGRQFMAKVAGVAKENTSGVIKVTVAIVAVAITMAAVIWAGGTSIGRMEMRVESVCESLKTDRDENQKAISAIRTEQKRHEDIIDEMRREAAYQKGVVNTKLEDIEKAVGRIESIVTQWEISYAEEAQTQN